MASPSGVTAQSFNPELLQHIFTLLPDDEDRKAALAVCHSWHAAAAANPSVWPAVQLWGHHAAALQADLDFIAKQGPDGLLWMDSLHAISSLERVVAVPARTRRVRLCGFRGTPHTLYGHLALLPAGLTHLELACRCSGPLPAALLRFTALRELVLSGNGAEVDWQCRGGAAALAKLTELHCDCRLDMYYKHSFAGNPLLEILPEGTSTHLPRQLGAGLLAADMPRLRSMQLVCSFGPEVEQLCRHLAKQGAMRELRLELIDVYDNPFAEELEWEEEEARQYIAGCIVALLTELSQASPALDLGLIVDTHTVDQDVIDEEEIGDARAAVQLPPMAGISTLRTLGVRHTPPPPDWRQLSLLTYLELGQKINWRRLLAGLAQLKRLWLNHVPLANGRLPAAVCHLPALRTLRLSGSGLLRLPAAFSSDLSSLEELTIEGFAVASVPAPVPQLTALKSLSIISPDFTHLSPGPYLAALTKLDLPELDFTDAGLPSSLSVATSLRRLTVGGVRTPRRPADSALLATLPRLRVLAPNDYGLLVEC